MIKWETLKVDYENKSFITENNTDIKVLGSFEYGGSVYALFSDSDKIHLVVKENENEFKRIEIEWFFNKENNIKGSELK